MKKILIVDDHPLVAEAVSVIVSTSFKDMSIIAASSAAEMRVHLAQLTEPDSQLALAFMDLNLPDGDGVDLILEITAHHRIPVIVLSGQYDDLTVSACVRNGASGFIQKNSKFDVYIAAINAVLSGGQFFPSSALAGKEARGNTILDKMTDRQRQVLDLLIIGQSNKMIADQLFITVGTVQNHITALLELFEARSRTQLIFAARTIGYRPRIAPTPQHSMIKKTGASRLM